MTYKRIRIRNDDVLVHSRDTRFGGKEFERFVGFHNMILQDQKHFIHVPCILSTEILDFPRAIDFIREETAAGRMYPEVHGHRHIDYAKLPYVEVVNDLKLCKEFIMREFEFGATKWYTPWGANAAHIKLAADSVGLEMIDTSKVIHPKALVESVRLVKANRESATNLLTYWEDKEIFRHWWQGLGAIDESIKFFSTL